jgi:hypothetical protein
MGISRPRHVPTSASFVGGKTISFRTGTILPQVSPYLGMLQPLRLFPSAYLCSGIQHKHFQYPPPSTATVAFPLAFIFILSLVVPVPFATHLDALGTFHAATTTSVSRNPYAFNGGDPFSYL